MKNFMNMHPVLADVCDTVLTRCRQLAASGSRHRLAEGISDRTVINLRQRSGYTL